MSDDKLDAVIDNEKEWRRYMLNKVDKIDEKLNGFQLRMMGLILILSGTVEIGKYLMK